MQFYRISCRWKFGLETPASQMHGEELEQNSQFTNQFYCWTCGLHQASVLRSLALTCCNYTYLKESKSWVWTRLTLKGCHLGCIVGGKTKGPSFKSGCEKMCFSFTLVDYICVLFLQESAKQNGAWKLIDIFHQLLSFSVQVFKKCVKKPI